MTRAQHLIRKCYAPIRVDNNSTSSTGEVISEVIKYEQYFTYLLLSLFYRIALFVRKFLKRHVKYSKFYYNEDCTSNGEQPTLRDHQDSNKIINRDLSSSLKNAPQSRNFEGPSGVTPKHRVYPFVLKDLLKGKGESLGVSLPSQLPLRTIKLIRTGPIKVLIDIIVKVVSEILFSSRRAPAGTDLYPAVHDPDNPTTQNLVKTINVRSLKVPTLRHDVKSSTNFMSKDNFNTPSEDKINVLTEPKTEFASRANNLRKLQNSAFVV